MNIPAIAVAVIIIGGFFVTAVLLVVELIRSVRLKAKCRRNAEREQYLKQFVCRQCRDSGAVIWNLGMYHDTCPTCRGESPKIAAEAKKLREQREAEQADKQFQEWRAAARKRAGLPQ